MKSNVKLVFGVSAIVIAGIVGCSSDDGQPGGSSGTSGTSGGTSGTSGGTSGAPASDSGAKKPLAATCANNDECESGECFVDNNSWCSLKCTADNAATVCVAPLSGACNKKGFCKKN